MMLGVVVSHSNRMLPFKFPKGLQVCAQKSLDALKSIVKPCLYATCSKGNSIWHQNISHSHKARVTQAWAKTTAPAYGPSEILQTILTDLMFSEFGIWG